MTERLRKFVTEKFLDCSEPEEDYSGFNAQEDEYSDHFLVGCCVDALPCVFVCIDTQ